MRKFSLLIVALMILIAAGCSHAAREATPAAKTSAAAVPENFLSYKGSGWSLAYPKDFKTEVKENGQVFFYAPYVKDPNEFVHNVNVNVVPNQKEVLTPAQMAQQLPDLLTSLGAQKESIKTETVKIPVAEAVKVSYEVAREGQVLSGMQIGFYQEKTLYTLTFTANKAGYDFFKADFEKMVNTFRFE